MTAPLRRSRPYLFWGQTTSLCETCLTLVPAKIEMRDNQVWYQKRCPQHGTQTTLVSTDAAYWKLCKDYLKPGDRPLSLQSRTEYGCPYDCGLCPDHEQHSCLALIDINEHCNLTCPVCFAEFLAGAGEAAAARHRRAHARCPGGERGRARPGAAFRRRADLASRAVRHPGRGAGAAGPPCHDQHQRVAHRPRAGFRGAAGGAEARARDLSAVRFAQARRADEPARRRSARRAPCRAREPRSGTASPPPWW